jgi:hypothetical protein
LRRNDLLLWKRLFCKDAASSVHLRQSSPNVPRRLIQLAQKPNSMHMHNAAGQTELTNDETPVELQEMARAIESLPARYRDVVAPALQRVVECSTRRRRILNLVQEALSQLRLDMKYLIFDLEATRRERDQYKAQLEGKDQE